MIRKLMQSIREFKLFSLLSPLFVVLEVVMEVEIGRASCRERVYVLV